MMNKIWENKLLRADLLLLLLYVAYCSAIVLRVNHLYFTNKR
ncbi:hypothetical protein BD749_2492 [Pontibacter ramchanderi]|uniref:Uncharacterized protein n=1 Tax=Pontibacter ramchanderi TaxID=1179743 RepID=A0A2N3UD85_9BACT|nr:hypothetical protein BD749_2492 [Pontibacter ramchanderi]